jgi:hypothetical protein
MYQNVILATGHFGDCHFVKWSSFQPLKMPHCWTIEENGHFANQASPFVCVKKIQSDQILVNNLFN